MPYIEQSQRDRLDSDIAELARKIASSSNDQMARAGVLNYAITTLILTAMPANRYADIALVTGVLENVKQEFYRRLASPYEDNKAKLNGDVYGG